jgi:hypothetical protein
MLYTTVLTNAESSKEIDVNLEKNLEVNWDS